MTDTDTSTICLTRPVADAYAKWMGPPAQTDGTAVGSVTEPTAHVALEQPQAAGNQGRPVASRKSDPRSSFGDLLVRLAQQAPGAFRNVMAGALLDLQTLTFQECRPTHSNWVAYVQQCFAEQGLAVSVSPELWASQKDVGKSSLLGPSGVYLTWLELMKETQDDD